MDDEQSEAADAKYVSSLNPEFGDARGFWNRYEELAEADDRELSNDLNANLDTLLIFAGLFSAINTAFISFTMPSLSPGSFDRTNALLELVLLKAENGTLPRTTLSTPFSPNPTTVLANCLLYASLCCSLLAAAGAMLGKEWLRNFDRKGQVASLGDQARLRQKKFRALQRWYFRESVQLFPYTLLLSVVLFFAGLVPYLVGINKAVAGVVIAFIACGVSAWTFTICSCVLDPYSPYQTVLTYFLHNSLQKEEERREGEPQGEIIEPGTSPYPEMGDANGGTPQSPTSSPLFFRRETIGNRDGIVLFNPSRTPEGNGPGPLVVPPLGQRNFTTDLAGEILHQTRKRTQSQFFLNEDEKHMLNAETVNWLLGITSKPEDLLIVAQNLCCLEFEARRIILQDSASWQRLLYFALDALQRWRDRPEQENKLTAEFLGAALCRLLMDEPRDGAKWREVRRQFKDKFFQSSKSSTSRVLSLSVLKSVLITSNNVWQEELKVAEYDLRKVFLQTQIFERRNEIWSILVGAIRVQYDDVILNLLAVLITARSDPSQSTSDLQALAIKAYNGKDLVQHLAAALTVHDKVFSAISDPRQLDALSEIYAAFMQKVHDYRRSNSNEVDGPSLDKLRQPLPDFILGLIKRVDVKKERCSFSWIRSVMKAVATVRAFEIDQTSRDAIYAALNYIITGSKTCRPEMDEFNLQQFTFSTLNAIARDIADLPPKSLGNEPGIIPYLVSAADGLDKWKWLTYFAEYPSIWMPNESKATELWKESPFIPNLLEGFKTTYDHRKQEELASIMVHIAKSKSSDWCTQLIITSDGLAQVVEESISSGSSARIPVVIALRPLLEVFDGPPIDWGTDLMYGIVRKLSASIVDKDSGLLGRLGEQDSGVDIATLIRFIKHVKGRRTYEGSSLATIEQALDCLSNIPRQPQPNKLVTS